MTRVTVCIATFQRQERLRELLGDMTRQTRLPDQVVVVDNDPHASARPIIDEWRRSGIPFTLDYDVQPQASIGATRNRTVQLASGQWLAFIDDDERAPPEWLQLLLYAAETFAADGVLGPVEPQVPPTAPAWIRRGKFYDFPHQADGAVVPLNRMRFGNVLLRTDRVQALPGPFNPAFGLMNGEDLDLLTRLAHTGAKIVWYDRAPVYEPIEAKRLCLRWLLLRAIGGGQSFARYTIEGGFHPISLPAKCIFFLRAALQALVASGMTVASLPFGRHRAAMWLVKTTANVGKLTVLTGWRYSAYARHEE